MKLMFKSSLTKSSVLLLAGLFFVLIYACKPAEKKAAAGAAGSDDISGLVLESIPGTSVQYARQIDSSGKIQIEGFVDGNKKTGQWIEYAPDGEIMRINHFVNGKLEGPAMTMAYRNQVTLLVNYRENELNGPWTSFKFGKVIEQRNYKAGKLDGMLKVYDDREFKLKQQVEYKNGVQDGYLRYYDLDGNVTLEYLYKNGEKVSGGIVTPKK